MSEQLEKNRRLHVRLGELLFPSGYPVAVKMLKTLEGMEDVKRPKGKRTLCQLISQSWYIGRSMLATADDLACYAAPGILGFAKPIPEEAWKRYVGWQMATEDAAKKTFAEITKFPSGEYRGILIAPLVRCPVDPDVVILFGNAAQMLVIVAAYIRNRGGVLTFTSSGIVACANVIVAPIKTGEPKVALPGNAWRLLGLPSDSDLICGIPGGLLDEIVESAAQLRATGGARYPVAWQHIDWEAQPPISEILKDEGYPAWLKR